MSQVAQPSQSKQQQDEQKNPTPQRARIVQRLMDSAASLPAFIHDLLVQQATMVAGTEAAAFLVQQQGEQLGLQTVDHIRPDESDPQTRQAAIQAFQNLVGPCATQGKDGAIEVGSPDGGDSQYCLVTVLRNEGQVVAVSAVITRCRDMERAKQRLNSMQIVAGYFDLLFLRRMVDTTRATADRHQHVLQYAGAVGTAEGFNSAASNLCNELANRTGASRVSLGWMKGRHIKMKALSHTERFDKKQELIVLLEKVMEECVDQEEPVRFDPAGNSTANVTRGARELSQRHGGGAVLSYPLRHRDEIAGVITLEFPTEVPLDETREMAVGVASEVLAPQLYDRYQNDRNIFIKNGLSLKWLAEATFGPKFWTAKLIIIASFAFIAAIFLIKPTYSVRAPFQLVALDRRTLCPPYDGTLEEVHVKPGQAVKAGQVLAKMKTLDLEMKLASAEADSRKSLVDADRYRKEGKIAEMKSSLAAADQAAKQADLYRYQISQASIISPMNGIVTKGDLFDHRGAPVRQGDTLFEIAQGDKDNPNLIANEVEMLVSERDIQLVKQVFEQRTAAAEKAKQSRPIDGLLATSSLPSEQFEFRIIRVVPNGEAKEGENVFKVYAQMAKQAPWMHPGLAGEAKVDIEKKSLAWTYTHRLGDWLWLKRWHWMP
ncbi:MAG: biotin/lipoyl-binding protein [Tepidisphaeraceae bacterium]